MRVCFCSPNSVPQKSLHCALLSLHYVRKHLGSLGRKITDHHESKVSLGHIAKPCQRKEVRRERRRDLVGGREGGRKGRKGRRKEGEERGGKILLLSQLFCKASRNLVVS